MKLQKILTAGLAVVAALTFTAACSDSSDDGATADPAASSATSSAVDTGGTSVTDPSQPPSAATLNGLLEKALNPSIPASQKTDLVQGSSADPQLFDKLVKAKQDNPTVTYRLVPPVIATGNGQATVKVQVKLPNVPEQTVDAAIVYDQGKWKLAKTTVCPLLLANNVQSAMCPAAS
ncbi:MAG: hypothetical protein INR72_04365 [Williamsia herbipolensis]|uniref:Low molecular weight antigen MTB12-like C-terminal domain-containing protein n=1 Tax=Williamsia serinedens TaxID=391736 RepID=A0ABT1H5J7_9NOCA|nr:hypothetical protein [Williamsia serinedens]MBE7160459.1 hypothetical protein [Williamsia herbipolensis]MCP2162508.1 hypothetical protein [Williamsia serinedens]